MSDELNTSEVELPEPYVPEPVEIPTIEVPSGVTVPTSPLGLLLMAKYISIFAEPVEVKTAKVTVDKEGNVTKAEVPNEDYIKALDFAGKLADATAASIKTYLSLVTVAPGIPVSAPPPSGEGATKVSGFLIAP